MAGRGSSKELPRFDSEAMEQAAARCSSASSRTGARRCALRVILRSGQDVGEPGLRVDIVEFGGLDQRIGGGGAAAAFVGAGEGPVVAPDRDSAQRAFGGVVRQAQAAVIKEARERGPALEAVVDRLGGLVLGGEPGTLLAAKPRTRR